jgi:hypothetical protein
VLSHREIPRDTAIESMGWVVEDEETEDSPTASSTMTVSVR